MVKTTGKRLWLVAGVSGTIGTSWRNRGEDADFYIIKGIAEQLLEAVNITRYRLASIEECPWLHPKKSGVFKTGDKTVCRFGELHPALVGKCDLKKNIALLEIRIVDVLDNVSEVRRYKEVSKQPASVRDIAVVIPLDVSAASIRDSIRTTASEHLENIHLFDVYTGDQVPMNKKSLAFSLVYRAPDRTLTDEEIQQYQDAVIETLSKEFGATLR